MPGPHTRDAARRAGAGRPSAGRSTAPPERMTPESAVPECAVPESAVPEPAAWDSVTFDVWGMTAHLSVTEAGRLDRAELLLDDWLATVGAACDRFRADSEISRLNAASGAAASGDRVGPAPVSAVFAEILAEALRVAEATCGAVDPTVGGALLTAGYDRDLMSIADGEDDRPLRWQRVPGWRQIDLDPARRVLRLPRGVVLDLGATGKAFAADRAARLIAAETGGGALVSLGGDIAVAGPPPAGGWPVHVTEDHRSGPDAPGQTVTVESGGLATSSTTLRRWRRDGRWLHHIIDPALGAPADTCWRTVTVAAADCVDANAAATAALVIGPRAIDWLSGLGVPARLVHLDGTVSTVGGWPAPQNPVQPSPGPLGPGPRKSRPSPRSPRTTRNPLPGKGAA